MLSVPLVRQIFLSSLIKSSVLYVWVFVSLFSCYIIVYCVFQVCYVVRSLVLRFFS